MKQISIISPLGRGGRAHGGISSYILTIAKALSNLSFNVELISFYPNSSKILNEYMFDGIELTIINGVKRKNAIKNLYKHYKKESPKCIIAAGQRSNIIASNISYAFDYNIPVYLSVHNTFKNDLNRLNFIRRKYKIYQLHKAYSRAEGIIAVSQGVAEDIVKYIRTSRKKIKVIYNPVPIQDIIKKANANLDHPWFLPGQPPVVLGVGRLVPQKDFQTLLNAFNLIRKNRKCRLLILGEGPERSKLEKMTIRMDLENDVSLPGFVENPFNFMRHASIFVLSSAWEGFGLVVVEALACNTPVVATNCPSGPAEILAHGRYGHLVPVHDEYSMAKAIEMVLDNDCTHNDPAQALKKFEPLNCARDYANFMNLTKQ